MIAVGGLAGLLIAAVIAWPGRQRPPLVGLASASAAQTADTVEVTSPQMEQLALATVESRQFSVEQRAMGQLAFNDDANTPVVAPFSGRVVRLMAKVSDNVKRGMPLLEIESPEVLQAQNDLINAIQMLDKYRAQSNLAKRSFERAKDLFEARAGSQRDLEQAQSAHETALIDQRAALAAVTGTRNRLRVFGRTEDEIARVERDHFINPTVIVAAPIDGTIIARRVGPGQYVRADNTEPLFLIADLGTIWLKANVSENDISYIRPGQPVEVTVGAMPGRVFNARISSVGAASDPVTHRVVVRSEIPNPDGVLKPEMFAQFRILTGTIDAVGVIPATAVVRVGDKLTSWVSSGERQFERRILKVGATQDGYVQVLEGLIPGERVVAKGAIFLDNERHN